MHRLFVAIRPPAAIRELLLAAMGGISGARWQSEDQLHLTLRFIGEVDRHRAGDIHAALGAVHQPPFEIALNGIGAFERRGLAGRGLGRRRPARAARRRCTRRSTPPSPASASRPTSAPILPHITLARLKRSSGPVGNLLEQAPAASPARPSPSTISPCSKATLTAEGGGLFDRRALPARLGADRGEQPVDHRRIGRAEQAQVHERGEELVDRQPLLASPARSAP